MSTPIVIEGTVPLGRRSRAARPEGNGAASPTTHPVASARVPRIARLLALAWHVEGLVKSGTVSSYAAAARLGHVRSNCSSSSVQPAVGSRWRCATS